MPKVLHFLTLILLFLPHHSEAQSLSLHNASYESHDGTLIIGRSTGIPGMFGRYTVLLNGRILGMLGEKQIIKKNLSSGRYTLTIRDDVEYRKFLGTTVRFSIESNQKKFFLLISRQKAFEPFYRIILKEVKRD